MKNQFLTYFRLPEMRIFWIFLPLLLVIAVINFWMLPFFLAAWSLGILIVIAIIIFLNSLSLSKSNLEIRRKEKELGGVIESMGDGVVVYDPNFRILVFSKAAEIIFNLSAKDVLEKEFGPKDIQNPKYGLFIKILFPALAPVMVSRSEPGKYPQVVDLSFTEPNLEFRISTSPIRDINGSPLGFVKIIRDQTRDIEILKSKGEFVTVASHQLRTPLSSLKWIFENLSHDKNLSPDSQNFVKDGLLLTEKMVKIVGDLLNVASLEEGKYEFSFEETDLADFINKILAEVSPQARQLGIAVYFEQPREKLPPILIDPSKLGMAFSNLLNNAIRYNVKNGEVAVAVQKMEGQPYVQISIRDTGIGIPQEELDKLFTKFFRASNAVKIETEGSGLGLYIVKNIIEGHGGRIWAESELGHGSIFYLTLPTDPSLVPQHRGLPVGESVN